MIIIILFFTIVNASTRPILLGLASASTISMPITARSKPNIALIKYWGNRNNELRLPAADSLSMTLNTPCVEVTVEHADTLAVQSFNPDGSEKVLDEKAVSRFGTHLELMKRYLDELGADDAIPSSLSLTIRSEIPPSIGIASSAAVFSCVAQAVAGLIIQTIPLTDAQVSILARLGSGSACRGIGDGYVAIKAGEGDAIDSSYALHIASPEHWMLHDIIIVPSQEEKKVGSTEGHALAQTSPHFEARIEEIKKTRQSECIDAIIRRDFEKLQIVSEEDCMDMHNVMQTSTPSLQYLNDTTHRVINDIKEMRREEHLPVLYTMDAGPTVHLFCTEEGRERVVAYAREQEKQGCTIFEAYAANGAEIIKEPSLVAA
jgi:diphosphomevalonate decarboxylase